MMGFPGTSDAALPASFLAQTPPIVGWLTLVLFCKGFDCLFGVLYVYSLSYRGLTVADAISKIIFTFTEKLKVESAVNDNHQLNGQKIVQTAK